MRVGVDGRSLVGDGARGVAHYTGALLAALAAAHPEDEYRVLLPRGRVVASTGGDGAAGHARRDGAAPVPDGVAGVRHPLPARVLFGAAAVAGRPRLDRLLGGCDVVWAPAPAPLAPGAAPFVLSVHDRAWELRPRDFTAYERAWHVAARPRALARRAARVMCGTAAVREELIGEWGLAPERVRVVPLAPAASPNGVPERPASAARIPAAAPTLPGAPYFLFVGALEPRKAPDVLGAAFRRARARGLGADLVVVGTGRLAAALVAPGVRIAGRVGRAELGALYRGALALVLPSHVEGFGLPPVEALAHGTPVIASDVPALREVLGPAGARFVAPGDADGLAAALLELAGDPAIRARLAGDGRAATRALDWAASARMARAILAEAAG